MFFGLVKMISCKEATYLASKREDKSLSWRESLRLIVHYKLCAICAVFEKQSIFIGKQARKLEAHNQDAQLPNDVKVKVSTMISNEK